MLELWPLVLEGSIIYRVETQPSTFGFVPGGKQHSSPKGSAPHQTQEQLPVLFGAKVIRININALLLEVPFSLSFVDVSLHTGLATSD